ncbi:MAG: RnfABCDGE type electron transport complex subunit G [bacterium]
MVRLVFVLTVICAVSSALLAAVFKLTEAPIAVALEERTRAAASSVMPAGLPSPAKLVLVQGGNTNTFFVAKQDGKIVAVATEGRSKNGYSGDVVLMVGMSADGKLVNYEVISASETPGLGTKISSNAFKNPLKGRSLEGSWKVKKDGGEVDAVTAATISSRAALDCIRDAISKRKQLSS